MKRKARSRTKPRPRKTKAKPPLSPRRKFRVHFRLAVDISLTEALIADAMSADFASYVYPLTSPAEVARHLAYNLVCNRAELRQLDGFALRDPKEVSILQENWDNDFDDIEELSVVPGENP